MSMAGYVTAVAAVSWVFVRHGAELRAREASSFCDFKTWPLVISPHFTPFWLKQLFYFFFFWFSDVHA